MSAAHWKDSFRNMSPEHLLPIHQRPDTLLYIARNMAMYKDGDLECEEMKGLWDVLDCWISRILDAQDQARLALYKAHSELVLPALADEMDLWIRYEIVSRQIGYPVYKLTLATIFKDQFEMFEDSVQAEEKH